ncbi:MAG: hypothetical protein KIT60_06840 [Burkholderiaceae bacterium]|nr:hypothetical protein [Burkholderiaceae bacterium]
MPFVKLPNGMTAHVKVAKPRAHRCAGLVKCTDGNAVRCARSSAYQCDWPITGDKTCDAHLCAQHAAEVGPGVHYCQPHLARHRKALAPGGLFSRLGVES